MCRVAESICTGHMIEGYGAVNEFAGYEAIHEEAMRLYCRSLPEDHRRRYAAIEALKIGYGGVASVARVLGMSRRTIHTGIRELQQMGEDDRISRNVPAETRSECAAPAVVERRSASESRS